MELDKLSLEFERALGDARHFAERRGEAFITPIHLLHVMLESGGALAAMAEKQNLNRSRLLDLLIHAPAADALLMEPNAELGEEEMKVRVEDGRVVALGKDLPAGSYAGENREDTAPPDLEATHPPIRQPRTPIIGPGLPGRSSVGHPGSHGHLPSMTNALVRETATVETIVRSAWGVDRGIRSE